MPWKQGSKLGISHYQVPVDEENRSKGLLKRSKEERSEVFKPTNLSDHFSPYVDGGKHPRDRQVMTFGP